MSTAFQRHLFQYIPMTLVCIRFILGLTILLLSILYQSQAAILASALMGLGLFSDIIDGIIARRLKVATPLLRRLDSQCDLIFWLLCLLSAHLMYPQLIYQTWPIILLLLGFELFLYCFSWWKFKRETCTHAYSAKLYGLGLGIGMIEIMLTGIIGYGWVIMAFLGIIACLDAFLILLFLPTWSHDIPSCWHAWYRNYRLVKNGL